MQIYWTTPARRDVNEAYDYIAERNPDAAALVEASILKSVERLANFPRMGRPGRREGTRELVISNLPYIVVYSVSKTRVTILRVLHGARQWLEEG